MRTWAAIMTILLVGLCSWPSVVVSSEREEQRLLKIQVAYLLNFGKFITWPHSDDHESKQPFVIGVYGANPFNGLLAGLEEKTVQGRLVQTRVVSSLAQTDGCQLLFVGDLPDQQLVALFDYLAGEPVLTVSVRPGFVRAGGMIELLQQGEYVFFSVNLGEAEKSGLIIPSQVLALAVEVLRAQP